MKVKLFIFIPALFMLVYSNISQALMVQSYKKAMAYDMFLPKDTGRRPARQVDNPPNENNFSASVNYNIPIAKKIFKTNQMNRSTIDIDVNSSRVFIPIGNKIRIVLEDTGNEQQQWYADSSKEMALINKSVQNGKVVLLFETLDKGLGKIYIDCVDKSSNGFKVVKSKQINVIVD